MHTSHVDTVHIIVRVQVHTDVHVHVHTDVLCMCMLTGKRGISFDMVLL